MTNTNINSVKANNEIKYLNGIRIYQEWKESQELANLLRTIVSLTQLSLGKDVNNNENDLSAIESSISGIRNTLNSEANALRLRLIRYLIQTRSLQNDSKVLIENKCKYQRNFPKNITQLNKKYQLLEQSREKVLLEAVSNRIASDIEKRTINPEQVKLSIQDTEQKMNELDNELTEKHRLFMDREEKVKISLEYLKQISELLN